MSYHTEECPFCDGGFISEDGHEYRCPDCEGKGYICICDNCGEQVEEDSFCEWCYAECIECGEVVLIEELQNELCTECAKKIQIKKGA